MRTELKGRLIMAAEAGQAADAVKPKPPADYDDYATGSAIHLVRNAQIQGLKLSQMADQKASILMGATFVVFSISVSRSLAGDLPWSLALLAVFAFLSSLCAVMAVLPSIKTADTSKIVPNNLFFGHFTQRGEEEWTEEVIQALRTDETVFRMMLHDIYQNGQVLQKKKYRFLGFAYKLFITGLILTMISFVIELGSSYR
jgi:hypothetical protein